MLYPKLFSYPKIKALCSSSLLVAKIKLLEGLARRGLAPQARLVLQTRFLHHRPSQMSPKGGRGGGGKKDGRKDPPREVAVSKAMSFILRHAAEREGVKIDSQGYANVGDLLQWRKLKSLKATFPEVLDAVSSSDKQRFGLLYLSPASSEQDVKSAEAEIEQPGQDEATSATAAATATAAALAANDPDPRHYLIRARQGHSIKSVDAASLFQELTLDEGSSTSLPDTVVHGTYHATWPKILESGGLKCMGRNQIHFASGPELSTILPNGIHGAIAMPPKGKGGGQNEGVISGMRGDAQMLIYIDLKRALAAGCPFWISENGVILSEGKEGDDGEKKVGMEFFDVVVERKNGLGVVWENGELLKETPQWMLNATTPAGKGERGRGGGQKKPVPKLKVEKETENVDYP